MRLSTGFWQTYKEVPADAEIPSHQLMIRAGLIHKSGSGLYNYLPFGLKAVQKVERIVREEMNRSGAFEVQMTMVTPSELWKESGRWELMTEMCKFKDKRDSEICLSPTNEEAVVEIMRKSIKSYKNLPVNLYQINTKFRDEIRPRFGLMRAREFLMKDAYSFHLDQDCLNQTYQKMYDAYERILKRIGLEYVAVIADAGAMAGPEQQTHEFQVVANTGEDEIAYCEKTGYGANIEKASSIRNTEDLKQINKSEQKLELVATPGMATIRDVCEFLKVPQVQSLKSLVYFDETNEKFFLILTLGDDELNEIKLKAAIQSLEVRPARDAELDHLGLPKGFIGPVGISDKVEVLYDSCVDLDAFYAVGGMKEDMHYTGFSPNRDGQTPCRVADVRLTKQGDLTSDGKGVIAIKRGIEVGHIFQLGDKYTKSMDFTVLDQNGKAVPPLMGCYGVGVSRVVAASIEQNHDENGIIWPASIAPAQIHFVAISKSEESTKICDEIYTQLLDSGWEVIYDDRKAGPGFKFKDADLLGLPIQLVFGERDFTKDGMLEIRERKSGKVHKISRDEILEKMTEIYKDLV